MATESYTLYYNTWSICSQMVRLTLAFRGQPKDGESEMIVEEKEVDIYHTFAQLDESFLTEINPKGKVPVLTHPVLLSKPMPESLDISYYIAKQYPSLLPESHKDQIFELLNELHNINFFALTFGSTPVVSTDKKVAVDEKLAQPGISEKYHQALEDKKKMIVQSEKNSRASPEEVDGEANNARTFLEKIGELYHSSHGQWLWEQKMLTVLDVHIVIFLARLYDAGRAMLIPQRLVPFYLMVIGMKEWQGVFQGRRTMMGLE